VARAMAAETPSEKMTQTPSGQTAVQDRPKLVSAKLTSAAVLLAILISLLWGTNPVALKIALRTLPPIGSAGLRFAIAAVAVWLWCRASGVRVAPRRGEALWLAAVGAFFVVQITTFTLGVYWGTASHSTVILNTYPFFVVVLAHFLIPGDRATVGRAAAVVAAFSGIVILFAGEWGAWQGTNLRGDSVQLASAFILGCQVVFLKYAVTRVDPGRVVLWQMIAGAAAFLLYSLGFEGLSRASPSVESLSAIVYQGLAIGALCFCVWTWLLRRYAASRVSIFGFISPAVGVALSALVLGEPLDPALLVSAGLVAAGIIIANAW